jgi:hypothetical protein
MRGQAVTVQIIVFHDKPHIRFALSRGFAVSGTIILAVSPGRRTRGLALAPG